MKTNNFKLKRKMVTCSRCDAYKVHFGLGMCSACLRRTKRENNPEFYLGTQYSEIKRRCTHSNVEGRNYQGKKFCSRDEFINRFKSDAVFLDQYKKWQKSGFKRGDAPSIDRIDNNGDYILENLQILPHKLNGPKDHANGVTVSFGTFMRHFKSQLEAAKFLNYPTASISRILNGKKENNTGYKLMRVKK